MCFVIHPSCPEPRTAKKNIPVKKYFLINSVPWNPAIRLCSPFRDHSYLFGIQPTVKIIAKELLIGPGYHSDSIKTITLGHMWSCLKCLIPKGSKYYYNPDKKEYVSEGLIITEERL